MSKFGFLLIMLLFAAVSCGNDNPAEEITPPDESVVENAGKTLIVYFSWSGNTRTVADIIRDLTGSDIVEIEVLEPYSSVYNEVTARARQELDNDVRPELKTRVENMDEYDTLIVGTPIWISRLAPAVKSFLAGHDLSGKNIAPFCTHGGSGTAQSVNNIRSVCPNSTILQSLAISGSRAESSRNDVERWLRTVNIIKETN
jgi:flavodoxin